MDFENIKKYLEGNASGQVDVKNRSAVRAMPYRFFERFNVQGLHVELVEPGRIICSIKVPPRLLNAGKSLHGGAIATLVDVFGSAVIYTVSAPQNTGVSVEINVSYLDSAYVNEEIEVEARILRLGKTVGVITVELRKKKSGQIIAQGRHTKYLLVSSKL
ncbi:unnamed protein product [Linum trigynum]|uniref:Thioesterase domain-containing protein n=1 Tax=Linum trigynum TaxID=586398 RepID=A0AAV2DDA2_9ROSI